MNNCTNVINHSRVKVEENKRKAIFINDDKHEYTIGKVDGCLIQNGERADYFVSNENNIVFIELKGRNIEHACSQLFTTAENDNITEYKAGRKIGFLIVCSRVPKVNTCIQKAQVKAKRDYKAKFKVICNSAELHIDET